MRSARTIGLILATAALVGAVLLYRGARDPGPVAAEPSATIVQPAPAPDDAQPAAAPTAGPADPAPAPETFEPPAEGIYAFPPPGTKPPLVGIIVPDDYELPPGYLRHYQSTDDGVALPPILMYNPYSPPLDHTGQPIEVRGDGVVPPVEAPPGMPVEILQLPQRPRPNSLRSLLEDR
jgi:hypothetical protein